MGTPTVIPPQPAAEGAGAVATGGVREPVRPAPLPGLDEALRLPVRARPDRIDSLWVFGDMVYTFRRAPAGRGCPSRRSEGGWPSGHRWRSGERRRTGRATPWAAAGGGPGRTPGHPRPPGGTDRQARTAPVAVRVPRVVLQARRACGRVALQPLVARRRRDPKALTQLAPARTRLLANATNSARRSLTRRSANGTSPSPVSPLDV